MDEIELTPVEKKIVGYSLFSLCMKMGPISFLLFEKIIDKLKVREQFEAHANNWLEYSERNKK
jgi:hypothetical protein